MVLKWLALSLLLKTIIRTPNLTILFLPNSTFYVVRLTEPGNAEGAISRARQHRLKICMTVFSCPGAGDIPCPNSPPSVASTATHSAAASAPESTGTDLETQTDGGDSTDDETVTCLDSDDWEINSEPSKSAQLCCSGLQTIRLKENGRHELMRLPDDFQFPAILSANILRVNPLDEEEAPYIRVPEEIWTMRGGRAEREEPQPPLEQQQQ